MGKLVPTYLGTDLTEDYGVLRSPFVHHLNSGLTNCLQAGNHIFGARSSR